MGQAGVHWGHGELPGQGEDSPHRCSSEPSEQSRRPSQCLLEGMQVPFGQRNPLHFLSGMERDRGRTAGGNKQAPHTVSAGVGGADPGRRVVCNS